MRVLFLHLLLLGLEPDRVQYRKQPEQELGLLASMLQEVYDAQERDDGPGENRVMSRRVRSRSAQESEPLPEEGALAKFKWQDQSLELFKDEDGRIGLRFENFKDKCFSYHTDYLANVKLAKITVSEQETADGPWPSRNYVTVDNVQLVALSNKTQNSSRLARCLGVAWAIMNGEPGVKAWDKEIAGLADILTECWPDALQARRASDIEMKPAEDADDEWFGFPKATNGEQRDWNFCTGCEEKGYWSGRQWVLALGKYYRKQPYCSRCWTEWTSRNK